MIEFNKHGFAAIFISVAMIAAAAFVNERFPWLFLVAALIVYLPGTLMVTNQSQSSQDPVFRDIRLPYSLHAVAIGWLLVLATGVTGVFLRTGLFLGCAALGAILPFLVIRVSEPGRR